MGVYAYPPEVHEFVRENCTKLFDEELAEACNERFGTEFTKSKMRAFRHNHRYRTGRQRNAGNERRVKAYPQEVVDFVRDNSWGVSSKDMAVMVNEKFGTNFDQHRMNVFRARHHIKSGLPGWYQRSHEPGNKGKKLEEYVGEERAAEIREKLAPTQFKKGHAPLNELPVGAISKTTDGYVIRKKQMEGSQWERWEFMHRAIWEEHNGPVPPGMSVMFKDGNKENLSIDNLMLVTKGESAQLTRLGLRSEDPELTELGLNIVRLRLAASGIKKRRR